ncbi:MAG: polyhydroxyalkanoate synthesis regulator DNA-binding domain-containing protein [Anaerolineae bacterium]
MRVIKRYSNRKLYDTTTRQYITLEGIATLIRQGEEVQVVDHITGDDLTALTLTQIILEQERKKGGYLPRAVLTGLVRAGGDTLASLSRMLVSPGDLLRQVDEVIEQRLQDLLKRGELAEEEFRRLRDRLLSGEFPLLPRPEPRGEDLVQALVQRGLPSRGDFEKLNHQVEALLDKLDALDRTG